MGDDAPGWQCLMMASSQKAAGPGRQRQPVAPASGIALQWPMGARYPPKLVSLRHALVRPNSQRQNPGFDPSFTTPRYTTGVRM